MRPLPYTLCQGGETHRPCSQHRFFPPYRSPCLTTATLKSHPCSLACKTTPRNVLMLAAAVRPVLVSPWQASRSHSSKPVLQHFRRRLRSAKRFPWHVSAKQQDTDEAGNTKADRGSNVKPAVVDAFKNGSLGFGFSAGGLLYPYYVGVVQQLHEMGVITRE